MYVLANALLATLLRPLLRLTHEGMLALFVPTHPLTLMHTTVSCPVH